jgi:hypothetical protein
MISLQRRLPLVVYLLNPVLSLSSECTQSWEAMSIDTTFQHWSNRLSSQCYVKYQNSFWQDSSSNVECRSWEYESHCTDSMDGRVCRLNNGAVDISTCVPNSCGDDSLSVLVATQFNPSTSSIDCTSYPSTGTPIIAAIVSTVLVLCLTAFAVFLLRAPLAVRETAQLKKARIHMASLGDSNSM